MLGWGVQKTGLRNLRGAREIAVQFFEVTHTAFS